MEPHTEISQDPSTLQEPGAQTEADLAETLAQSQEQLLRALAEVENVRKRGERAVQEARVYAIERFARDLMAVSDHLQRAVQSAPETPDESVRNLIEGVQLTEKSLTEIFSRHGLRAFGNRGDRFDPNLHQAVAQIPSDIAAGAVAEVFQAGYTLGDRTVRAAMVAVSLGMAKADPAPSQEPQTPEPAAPAERIDITT